jgi:D-alanyl-D-alanine carboxypeptidase/D-alanyl-D-alanine-endopeptidase (penicillin-binding protein 4)
MKKLLALLLLLTVPAWAAPPLSARIRTAIHASPVARTAFWGIQVTDLQTGVVLFSLNADHYFVPASNTKLFTTALALTRLGPDFKVKTVVSAEAPLDAEGRTTGNLVLTGNGDANLSGRVIPYDVAAAKGDPLSAMQELAGKLYDRGVRQVDGNIIGDDTAFVWEPFGPGWGIDDPVTSDGAAIGALEVNDNTMLLNILPGAAEGDGARLSFDPPLEVFTLVNRLRTTSAVPREIHVERQAGSNVLRVWGAIPPADPGLTESLSVDDPARYAAVALLSAMRSRGIVVNGVAMVRHRYPGADSEVVTSPVLAERESAPLREDLRVTDKVSQNLHAEMLLRLVGKGSRRAGLEELQTFLGEAGIDPKEVSLRDGSGMSRQNMVTPHAISQLLIYMAKSPESEIWTSLLPVAGVDGSLRERFLKSRMKSRISAKTGTLSHVSALSGYATRRSGRRVVFSIMVNNYSGSSLDIRTVIDKIGSLLE